MPDPLDELISFLSSPSIQISSIALANLLPFTASSSPKRSTLSKPEVIDNLKRLGRVNDITAHDALKALINLTDQTDIQRRVGDKDFLLHLIRTINSQSAILADLCCMLLSNLSQLSSIASLICTLRNTSDNSPIINNLIETFIVGESKKWNKHANYDFLANVFANLGSIPEGRELLLTPPNSSSPLSKISIFTQHPSLIRRGGVASCIKNCCFSKLHHKYMLTDSEDEINVLPAILLPLCGQEEYNIERSFAFPTSLQMLPPNQTREPDAKIRHIHLESLLLLCTTRVGRDLLREKEAYEVLRVLHTVEKDERVLGSIQKYVSLTMRDESAETQAEADIEESKIEDDKDIKPVRADEEEEEDDDLIVEEM